MNGRWAMHATAGILFTDAVGLPKFWEAGEAALGDWDIKTLVAIQVVVMSFLEAARIRGFMATGESGVVGNFLRPHEEGLPRDEGEGGQERPPRDDGLPRHGVPVRRDRHLPLEGLKAHMANPTQVNIFTSAVGGEFTAAIMFASIAPCYFLLKDTIGDGKDDEFRPIPW